MARVLIVDDEQGFRRSIQQFLKKEGHKVAAADCAEKALEILKEREFDVVVTDIVMPRMDGMNLLKGIRENHPLIPVIIITGEPTVDTAIKAVQAGAFDYLVKPFSREDICKTVRNAANQKALEDENRQYREHMEELVDKRGRDLRKSEKRYRLLAENSKDAIWLMKLGGRFSYISPYVERMTGFSPEEIMSLPPEGFLAPGSMAEIEKLLADQLANRGNSVRLEQRQRRKDGSEFDVEINATWVLDKERNPIAIQGVSRDITERKQAEETLKKWAQIFEHAEWGVVVSSQDGKRMELMNPAYAKMHGYTVEELSGKPVSNVYTLQGRKEISESIRQVNEKGHHSFEADHVRKDGSVFPALVNANSVKDEDGNFLYRVVNVQDITDRKQAKETLRDSEERYKTLVDTTGDGMAILRDGFIVFVSKRVCEILDRLSSDIVGSHFSILFAKDKLARIDELHELYISGESDLGVVETEMISPDGSSIGVEINGARYMFEGQESVLISLRDITERKRAEEALQQSEEKYRLMADNVADNIWIVGLSDMRFSYISPAVEVILGYTPKEVLKLELSAHMTPESLEKIATMVSEELKKEDEEGVSPNKFRVLELEQIRKDGSKVWTEISAGFLRDDDDRPDRILGVTRDITERKRNEEALRKKERETGTLLFSMINAFVLFESVFDEKGKFVSYRFVFINKAYEEITGVKNEAVKGKTVHEVWPETEPKWIKRYGEVAVTGQSQEFELYHDPTKKLYHCQVYRPFDTSEMFCVIFEDITDRKRAEEALRKSEKQLSDAVKMAHLGHWEYDNVNDMFTFNDHFYKMFRTTAEQVGGYAMSSTEYVQRFVHPEDAALVGKGITKSIETTDPNFNRQIEHRMLYGDGTVGYISVRFFIVKNKQGQTINLYGVNQDITERKRAEKEKEKLEGQLRQAQKMEAVGRLAGGVAHDFNNILTGINGYSEMIIEGLPADDPLRPNMEVILSSGRRAAGLTAQLLAFSRKQVITPKVIAPNDILLDSQKMLRRIIGEDIDFIFTPGKRLWRINADPTQLDQVLMNLAVNARDAMPNGGKLTVETQNVTLDDEYCKSHPGFIPGDYVMLAVTDTGHGMNAETLENIFEPFYSTKEVGKGTGLGLAMVYGVMKQNNGFINVDSEPGAGTTFKIYYPAHKERAENTGKSKLTDMPTGTETVLLVEDEEIVRNLSKTVLERQGYTVIVAPDGKKAHLEYTQYSGEIDLLLADVVMPKMNGRELYKKLLDLKPGLKALFMSGYTEDAIAHHGVLDKGTHFLQKPFTIQALAKAVRRALDGVKV